MFSFNSKIEKGKVPLDSEKEEQDENYESPSQTNKGQIPQCLNKIIPFDEKNPNQQFYRQIASIGQSNGEIIRHGWRIFQIDRYQQDQVLYYFAHLQSTLNIPFTFFTLKQSDPQKLHISMNYLWMQSTIISSNGSGKDQKMWQLSFYSFVKQKIVNLLRNFIKNNFNWLNMVSEAYSDEELMNKFREQVVKPFKYCFREFTVGKNMELSIESQQE